MEKKEELYKQIKIYLKKTLIEEIKKNQTLEKIFQNKKLTKHFLLKID